MTNGLLTERQAADFLNVSTRCLQAWRYRGEGGPNFVRISARCIRYRPEDLEKFAADRIAVNNITPTGLADAE